MIVKLKEEHRMGLMKLLHQDPDYNLYMIGDVENYGFDEDFQDVWGNVVDGNITSVLLRYHVFFMYYSPFTEEVTEYAEIMKHHDQFEVLSGKMECVSRFIQKIEYRKLRELHLAKLDEQDFHVTGDISRVRTATLDDIPEIYELYGKIDEFNVASLDMERLALPLRTGTGRIVYLRGEGGGGKDRIISSVATTAETSTTAVLVGLMTDPNVRGKGHAMLCMEKICNDLMRERKQVYLTYDNPDAGRIYRNVGFREIGRWGMLEMK